MHSQINGFPWQPFSFATLREGFKADNNVENVNFLLTTGGQKISIEINDFSWGSYIQSHHILKLMAKGHHEIRPLK